MPLHHVPKRGFASMDKTRQREIASMGGRRAHEMKVAHEWNKETAAAAGRKVDQRNGR